MATWSATEWMQAPGGLFPFDAGYLFPAHLTLRGIEIVGRPEKLVEPGHFKHFVKARAYTD
jgi:hypothetical protein